MLANLVAIEKQNAAVRDQHAATVRISRYNATMPTENEIASRSRFPFTHPTWFSKLNLCRQFGSMAEKVADYERILRDLQTRVSEDDASLIRNSLDRVRIPI